MPDIYNVTFYSLCKLQQDYFLLFVRLHLVHSITFDFYKTYMTNTIAAGVYFSWGIL